MIDFGIARIEDHTQITQPGGVIGTPAYMTPEQLRGQPLTTAVDVFSWAGVVVYAATGRPPFGTGTQTMYGIAHGEPDLGTLAEPLRGLVTDALAKDPAARPTAAQLMERLSHQAEVAGSVAGVAHHRVPGQSPAAMVSAGLRRHSHRSPHLAEVAAGLLPAE